MGNIFSCCKESNNINNEPLLKNSMYCNRCNKVFTFNDYQKHIYKCNYKKEYYKKN